MRRMFAAVVLVSAVLAGPAVEAQEEAADARPGVSVVRYFKCPMGQSEEAVRILNEEWRAYAERQIEEGRLLDYGILVHSWGDEWNVMDYFVAEDMEGWRAAWSAMLSAMSEADPEGEMYERFSELCTEHKDNIYTVVPPPDATGEM